MEILNKLKRKLERFTARLEQLKATRIGMVMSDEYSQGFDVGYASGQVASYENAIDLLEGVEIPQPVKHEGVKTVGYPSKVHALKCDPSWFEESFQGRKLVELRRNDRGYEVGHGIILQETVDNAYAMQAYKRPLAYTGRECAFIVSGMVSTGYGLEKGVVALSLVPWDRSNQVAFPKPIKTGPPNGNGALSSIAEVWERRGVRMTAKADGNSLYQFLCVGWELEQLINHEFAEFRDWSVVDQIQGEIGQLRLKVERHESRIPDWKPYAINWLKQEAEQLKGRVDAYAERDKLVIESLVSFLRRGG